MFSKKKMYEYTSQSSTRRFTELSQVAILIHERETMHLPIKKKGGGLLMHCGQKPISDYFLLFPKVKGGRE